MRKYIFFYFFISLSVQGQTKFPKQEISVNGFRNPSIGLEYRYQNISFHGGYYLTNLEKDVTTRFLKAGVTYWLLPLGKRKGENQIPSSFYLSTSYARGLNLTYENKDALMAEAGFRWMIWRGLNLRLGVAALISENRDTEINPTPGISYSFSF